MYRSSSLRMATKQSGNGIDKQEADESDGQQPPSSKATHRAFDERECVCYFQYSTGFR